MTCPPPDLRPGRITAVHTRILDIPLRRPHRFALLTIDTQSVLLIRVITEGGIEGIGEGVVPGGPWWGGESVEGMQAMIDRHLAPAVLGGDALQVGYLAKRLDSAVAGAPFAKAGLEMALWDACGQRTGLPLHQLLGGKHRDSLPVTWALGIGPADALVAEGLHAVDEIGHRALKLKMGAQPPAADVARVVEFCAALADRAQIAVDLNGSWDELTARRWLPRLADGGVSLIEQPVPAWNIGALARLRPTTGAALMADESLRTLLDAKALVDQSAVDVFAVKAAKSGGIAHVRRITDFAEAHGVACYGGTTIETSLGTSAAAHTLCSSGAVTAGTELFGPLLLADDIVQQPVSYVSGDLQLPDGAGLGMRLDETKVATYARR